MKGKIRAKGVCPVCNEKFIEVIKLGFLCKKHQTLPKRFFVDLFYKGQRIKLFSDKQGQPLDSFQRASNLLSHINYEIKTFTFDPTKYVKQELSRFYITHLLDKFLTFKLKSLAPSYQKDYRRYVTLAKNFFGMMDVREIKRLDIINYRDYLENNFDFSNKTIKNILDNFKTFMRYLRDDLEIIDTVPTFPSIETSLSKPRWLTAEVQQKAIETIPEEHRPIFIFLMLQGCRPGEARALKCKDVNLKQGTITISATFSGRVYRKKRKGRNAKNLTIPIHPEIFPYLQERVESNLPEAFLFVNSNTNKHYSENKLRKIWEDVREKVGLEKSLRLYDATRHSFASQLINKGVSLFNVSKLLGHSSTKMTEIYSHSDLEKLKIDMANLSLKSKTVTKVSLAKKRLL